MSLSRSSGVPLYVQIKDDIERKIRSGEWAPHAQVPPESTLQLSYGVSRITVQQAIRALANRGLLARYPGRGTFVTGAPAEENLLQFINFVKDRHAIEGAHRVIASSVSTVEGPERDLLQLGHRDPAILLSRLKLDAAEHPVALERSLVPFERAPYLLKEPLETLNIYHYLRTHGVTLAEAKLYVTPHALEPDEARQLELQPGAAVFRWERLTYDDQGRPVETSTFIIRGDVRKFYVQFSMDRDGAAARRQEGETTP
ncbi:MAG TPA: GntR family transcriptional regulator [Candidatus Dormibacteraeota bacterium]|nr:GntR family transcriptional regulator [Candidatus Dormibacteraeota bacterium]